MDYVLPIPVPTEIIKFVDYLLSTKKCFNYGNALLATCEFGYEDILNLFIKHKIDFRGIYFDNVVKSKSK